jgi:hypothetical protein
MIIITEFDKDRAIMKLLTSSLDSVCGVIICDDDLLVDSLIKLYERDISLVDKNFQVVVFDYDDTKYHNGDSYVNLVMQYYLKGYELSNEDLGTKIFIYRNIDKYILDGYSLEEKIKRLTSYCQTHNIIGDYHSFCRGSYYVMPNWLYELVSQYNDDFQEKLTYTFNLDSKRSIDYPDWFDVNLFNKYLCKK